MAAGHFDKCPFPSKVEEDPHEHSFPADRMGYASLDHRASELHDSEEEDRSQRHPGGFPRGPRGTHRGDKGTDLVSVPQLSIRPMLPPRGLASSSHRWRPWRMNRDLGVLPPYDSPPDRAEGELDRPVRSYPGAGP